MPLLLVKLVCLAFAVAAISITVAKAEVFKWLREGLGWKVLKCPYCVSHWAAFVIVLIANPKLGLATNPVADWFLTSMALVGISPRLGWWIYSSYAALKPKEDA